MASNVLTKVKIQKSDKFYTQEIAVERMGRNK
jgi:hypothetical protein